MPIRFRCAYCKQLMGIGRRKVGAIVRCPRLAGEVIVPATEDMPAANGAGQLNDLESEDFGKELAAVEPMPRELPNPLNPPPDFGRVHMTAPPVRPQQAHADVSISYDVRRPGLFLPTRTLIVAVALLVASLAVVFGLGCVLGRWIGR